MGNRLVQYLLLAAVIAFLGAFLLAPIFTVVALGIIGHTLPRTRKACPPWFRRRITLSPTASP